MKKILIVTSGFPRWETEGLNVFMLEFAQSIAKNYEVFVLAPFSKRSRSFETIGSIKVYRHYQFPVFNAEIAYGSGIVGNIKKNPLLLFAVPFYFFLQMLAIRKIVRKHNIGIINAHWIVPQGVTAALYKYFFNRKVKILCTIQGSDYLTLNNFWGNFLKKIALSNTDAVSAVSAAIKEKLENSGYKKPVYHYPWGVDTEKFSPLKTDRSLKEKIGAKGNLILYVGGLIEGKGIRPLVHAMKPVAEKFPGSKLLLIGEGYLLGEMKDLAIKLGIENNIFFAGVIPNQDLPPYFATADVFILPSYSEGYPAVVRESLSSETITVVTDLPAFNAIPGFDEVAIKVKIKSAEDIAEKLIAVFENKNQFEEIRKKGRKFILETSDWKVFAEKYRTIFEAL